MSLFILPGHKIGKPSPLFNKIDQSVVDELKKKYAGVQQQSSDIPKPKSKLFTNAEEIEKAIDEQGTKVRQLKSSGVEKSVWQPEVTILLELKKQLESLKLKEKPTEQSPEQDIKKLEGEITAQVNTNVEILNKLKIIVFI